MLELLVAMPLSEELEALRVRPKDATGGWSGSCDSSDAGTDALVVRAGAPWAWVALELLRLSKEPERRRGACGGRGSGLPGCAALGKNELDCGCYMSQKQKASPREDEDKTYTGKGTG